MYTETGILVVFPIYVGLFYMGCFSIADVWKVSGLGGVGTSQSFLYKESRPLRLISLPDAGLTAFILPIYSLKTP